MSDRPRFPWEKEPEERQDQDLGTSARSGEPDGPPAGPRADEPGLWRPREPEASADTPESPAGDPGDDTDQHPTLESVTFASAREGSTPPSHAESAETAGDEDPGHDSRIDEEAAPRTLRVRSLSRRRARTLAAVADALIPPGGALPSARGTGVVERADMALMGFEPAARARISSMLRVLEWAPVLSRSLRTFSRLNAGAAEAAFSRALNSRSGVVRAAAETCKELIVSRWSSVPEVEWALGQDYSCVTSDQPRAREAIEVLTIDRDHVEGCDVVVVGSGAGGAVAARELAEVGLSVVVLEEGSPQGRAAEAGAPALRRDVLYRANGLSRADGKPGARLLMGMGVGGSTLVSYGTAMRAPDAVLDGWAASGLEGFDAASMRPYFERVERTLRVQPMDGSLAGNGALALGRGAKAMGVAGVLPRRAVEGCRGCGVCDAGCPSDAILSAAETYLPRAQRAGATIIAGAKARAVIVEDGRATGVTAVTASGATLTVRAKVVILAAGAIHTPALLADSALGDLSGRLGTNLSVRPTTIVAGVFGDELRAWKGVQQSLIVTEWLASHGLLLHAFGISASSAGWALPGAGRRFADRLEQLGAIAAVQVSVSDAGTGRVVRGRRGHPRVSYGLTAQDARRLIRGAGHAASLLFAAGARTVLTSVGGAEEITTESRIADAEDRAVEARAIKITATAPSGTAAISAGSAEGVCDANGAVRGVEALFVADASALPSCPGVPPQSTVMATATRTVDHLVRASARYF